MLAFFSTFRPLKGPSVGPTPGPDCRNLALQHTHTATTKLSFERKRGPFSRQSLAWRPLRLGWSLRRRPTCRTTQVRPLLTAAKGTPVRLGLQGQPRGRRPNASPVASEAEIGRAHV